MSHLASLASSWCMKAYIFVVGPKVLSAERVKAASRLSLSLSLYNTHHCFHISHVCLCL
jgi:hypothetical protein